VPVVAIVAEGTGGRLLPQCRIHAAVDRAGPWPVIGLMFGCAALRGGGGLALVYRVADTAGVRAGAHGISGLRMRGRRCVRAARRSTPRG